MKKKEYSSGAIVLIYVRYLLPIFFFVVSLGMMRIDCLEYSTNSVPISTTELFNNAWSTVRYYLFSGNNTEATQKSFSEFVVVLLPVLVILFIIGAVSSIAVAFFAIRHISDPTRENDIARMWFITFIPNRIVACLLYSLTLPLLFLPRIMLLIYKNILQQEYTLKSNAAEPWIWGLVFVAITVILSIVCAESEKNIGIDVFKKREKRIIKEVEYNSVENDDPLNDEEIAKRAKQAEIIKMLLDKDNDHKNDLE